MDEKLQEQIALFNVVTEKSRRTRNDSLSPHRKSNEELLFLPHLAYIMTLEKGNVTAISIYNDKLWWSRNKKDEILNAKQFGQDIFNKCMELAKEKDSARQDRLRKEFVTWMMRNANQRICRQILRRWDDSVACINTFKIKHPQKVTKTFNEWFSWLQLRYSKLVTVWGSQPNNVFASTFTDKYYESLGSFCSLAKLLYDTIKPTMLDATDEEQFRCSSLNKLSLYTRLCYSVASCCFNPVYTHKILEASQIEYVSASPLKKEITLKETTKYDYKIPRQHIYGCIHAELNLYTKLKTFVPTDETVIIGIGKNLCELCLITFGYAPHKIICRNSHRKLYKGWCFPSWLDANQRNAITKSVQQIVKKEINSIRSDGSDAELLKVADNVEDAFFVGHPDDD